MADERNRSAKIEYQLKEWNVPFEYVDELDLDSLVVKTYSQVRTAEHRAPRRNVERYATQMANGAVFPAIVVAANDRSVIDGNTRIAAARRCGYTTFPAYLAKVADGAMAKIIGATFNMDAGESLTDDELAEAAQAFLDRRFTDMEIARCLGRSAEWARKFRKRTEFTERAAGHKAMTTVKATVAERLADIPQDAALTVALDAVADGLRVDVGSAAKIVDAARKTHSDKDAVAAVNEVLAALKPLDQAPKVSGSRDRATMALRKAMKECIRHVAADQKLVELLEALDVPLIEPAATEYRETLDRLRSSTMELAAAVEQLAGRLPAANAA